MYMVWPLLFLAPITPNVAVMIHGAGGGGWEYDYWKPVFEKAGWKVIARDLVPVRQGLAKTTFDDYTAQVKSWVPKHKRLVLIGASMGGPLALKAAEALKPDAIILVNPAPIAGLGVSRSAKKFPPVVRWANGPFKDTVDSMPDSDLATQEWAWKRWRDESGAVMTTLRAGVKVQRPACSVLVMIGEDDTDVPPKASKALAQWARADVKSYYKTSHVGPLMGRKATSIASDAVKWLLSKVK